jgi:translation machinery-associated protein 16
MRTADIYSFFYHALPPDAPALTTSELHALISDVWLARHNVELEHERQARRKGRPKSTRELKLEELKLREGEEYRTGMGTHGLFFTSLLITLT